MTFGEIANNYLNYSIRKCDSHYDMAEMYKNRHRFFGIVVVLVTAIVGTSVFASLGKSPESWIQIFTGFLSIAAVVLSSLQTFLGFSEYQSQHKASAAGYGSCRRDLELLIMKFPEATGKSGEAGTMELELIKKSLDDLDKASPTIPDKIWASYAN